MQAIIQCNERTTEKYSYYNPVQSHPILPYSIQFNPIPFYPIQSSSIPSHSVLHLNQFNPILFYSIQYRSIPSHSTLFNQSSSIPSHSTLFDPVQSHPILFYSIHNRLFQILLAGSANVLLNVLIRKLQE